MISLSFIIIIVVVIVIIYFPIHVHLNRHVIWILCSRRSWRISMTCGSLSSIASHHWGLSAGHWGGGLREKNTGRPHISHGKIHGFLYLFPLKAIRWHSAWFRKLYGSQSCFSIFRYCRCPIVCFIAHSISLTYQMFACIISNSGIYWLVVWNMFYFPIYWESTNQYKFQFVLSHIIWWMFQ